jgi:glycogen debranching enzyme
MRLIPIIPSLLGFLAAVAAPAAAAAAPANRDAELARKILGDENLREVHRMARKLLQTGLTAGSGYGEVWIRDLNTFIELALGVNEPALFRESLLTFFKFQGPGGDIVDGYIPKERARAGYKYRASALAPALMAHKNTVETDQESSLVQAIHKYVAVTGDRGILDESIDGRSVRERLEAALDYVMRERFDRKHGLVWGATTADWGDVQPEHAWGVELDDSSHRAIDIYDNAMFIIAIESFLHLVGGQSASAPRWTALRDNLKRDARKHLWDAGRQKFIAHLYLGGSPFPAGFDESVVYYHGGTAVAIEAGLLTRQEIIRSLARMRANVRQAGAGSLGLTLFPTYPEGAFKNPGMVPFGYQNGGDWCWFGGRMIQQLIRHGLIEDAYRELQPMVARVRRAGDFHEWWSRDNQPRGSKQFRGSAGVLGRAIEMLTEWAAKADAAPAGR